MKIENAIQQRFFKDIRQKAGINLLYTASWFSAAIHRMLKPYDITMQQFNIMRILRGQNGKPASLRLVTERMLDPMSNTSRLIDKLEKKGLVDRRQCPKDRRQVDLLLTAEGAEILEKASRAVEEGTLGLLELVSDDELAHLNDLLDCFRRGQ